jgi:hypothetical protein
MATLSLQLYFEDLPSGLVKTIGGTVSEADITNFVTAPGRPNCCVATVNFLHTIVRSKSSWRRSRRCPSFVAATAAPESAAAVSVAFDYLTGENDAGTRSLFSWRIGRTPACGGQLRPGPREAARTRSRSFRSL